MRHFYDLMHQVLHLAGCAGLVPETSATLSLPYSRLRILFLNPSPLVIFMSLQLLHLTWEQAGQCSVFTLIAFFPSLHCLIYQLWSYSIQDNKSVTYTLPEKHSPF